MFSILVQIKGTVVVHHLNVAAHRRSGLVSKSVRRVPAGQIANLSKRVRESLRIVEDMQEFGPFNIGNGDILPQVKCTSVRIVHDLDIQKWHWTGRTDANQILNHQSRLYADLRH